MPRYNGTIAKMTNQHCGFIDRKTATRLRGGPANFKTELDIFVHQDDVADETHLESGANLTFEITSDLKREGGLRAKQVREASGFPIFDGVELHFDEQVIDHPLVPIRWCIKPEIFELMREQKDRQWAIILVAQTRQPDPDIYVRRRHSFKSVVGMRHIGDGRGYFTFPAPGDYDLVVYLINSLDSPGEFAKTLERASQHMRDVWDDDELETTKRLSFLWGPETLVALSHIQVSVPDGIFAKPLPRWVNAWLGYFGLQKPRDECATRGRLFVAFTLGVAWYLLWEAVKRTYMLLLGFGHLLLGGNPFLVWREIVRLRLSALVSDLGARDEYEPLMRYTGWKVLVHPALLTFVVSIAGAWIHFPWIHNIVLGILYVVVAIAIVVGIIYGIAVTVVNIRDKTKKPEEKKAQEAAERDEQMLARVKTYAVCGAQEPDKVPVTVGLVWTGIKRRVCRTYA